jgi:ribosomal protein L37AE/L43A
VTIAAELDRPICPLCHTVDTTVTEADLATGGEWRCTTCGQRWDAERLGVVAAYAQFVASRASSVVTPERAPQR